ncbi:hypothetical protein [Actinomadura gamaensis]|uniref:Uncharacterized protein n=1 Tax=Actinomadura gamaensis TaxID=1763541 RepID=A0ABV9U7G3_9ACTN
MRRTTTVLAAGALLGGVLVPASAEAAAPSWKVARYDAKAGFDGVAAINGKNVWVVGGGSGRAHTWRFDGRRWTEPALPAAYRKIDFSAVAGSAPDNVWAFGSVGRGTQVALRWDGRAWRAVHTWKITAPVVGAVVNGPKDVWAYGSATDFLTFSTYHFDGRTWTHPRMGFQMSAGSVASAKDLWVTAHDRTGAVPKPVVARWNGKSWAQVKLPALPVERQHQTELSAIAARSSSDVWVAGTRYVKDGPDLALRPIALHWNGRAWKRLDPPGKNAVVSLASDGSGGVWASTTFHLYHYAKGRWTQAKLPARKGKTLRVAQLSRVPGGTSVWGSGDYIWGRLPSTAGAIIRY